MYVCPSTPSEISARGQAGGVDEIKQFGKFLVVYHHHRGGAVCGMPSVGADQEVVAPLPVAPAGSLPGALNVR